MTDPASGATPRRRCRATAKQTKQQCRRAPVPGALVCKVHGGAAPQVQRKARERLLEAADAAAAKLAELVESDDETIAVRAATALLDRAGYGPSSTQITKDGGKVNYRIDGVDLEAL